MTHVVYMGGGLIFLSISLPIRNTFARSTKMRQLEILVQRKKPKDTPPLCCKGLWVVVFSLVAVWGTISEFAL